MAQPPHFNPQIPPNVGATGQQNLNLHQMLNQTTALGPGNMQMQYAGGGGVPQQQAAPTDKTIISDFEKAFQSCLAPLLPGTDNQGTTSISPDKLRSSVDHSIQQFTDAARRVESYFLRKHATVAQQQPELLLQEEIEELREEISRRDTSIRMHAAKVKNWQESLRSIRNYANDKGVPVNVTPIPQPVGIMQQDLMQMGNARR